MPIDSPALPIFPSSCEYQEHEEVDGSSAQKEGNEGGRAIVSKEEAPSLVQRLRQLESAGSYALQCDVETLRAAAAAADLALFDANLKGVRGRQNLLNTLALAAVFPPEFGVNWDALADALCDLSWHGKVSGYVLLLRNAKDTLGLSPNDREIAQDLLDDTVVYWRQRRKPFWIFFA